MRSITEVVEHLWNLRPLTVATRLLEEFLQ